MVLSVAADMPKKAQITSSQATTCLLKICSLKKKNITGIVIGKAYYSGTINLEEAIKVSKNA